MTKRELLAKLIELSLCTDRETFVAAIKMMLRMLKEEHPKDNIE